MPSWEIRHRSLSNPRDTVALIEYATEALARAAFELSREHAQKNGGSAVLVCDGRSVASFSHWAENE